MYPLYVQTDQTAGSLLTSEDICLLWLDGTKALLKVTGETDMPSEM